MTLMPPNTEFVETPLGIFTVNGNWFYTNSEQLNAFAPGLLEKVGIDQLISDAEVWVKSTDAVSIVVFLVFLQLFPAWIAAVLSLPLMGLWHLSKSALVSRTATSAMRILTHDAVILVLAVLSISYMGIQQNYLDFGIGLVVFFLFRFGWIRKGFDRYYNSQHKGIGLNDRLLKMIVIRAALSEGLTIPELKRMEDQILSLMEKRTRPSGRKR
jgi:hypothetical protein